MSSLPGHLHPCGVSLWYIPVVHPYTHVCKLASGLLIAKAKCGRLYSSLGGNSGLCYWKETLYHRDVPHTIVRVDHLQALFTSDNPYTRSDVGSHCT